MYIGVAKSALARTAGNDVSLGTRRRFDFRELVCATCRKSFRPWKSYRESPNTAGEGLRARFALLVRAPCLGTTDSHHPESARTSRLQNLRAFPLEGVK